VTDDTAIAVLDRFEGDRAVLVVERDGGTEEVVLDRGALPEAGRHADAVFRLRLGDGTAYDPTYLPGRTAERRGRARRRFDRLSRRPPSDPEPDPDGEPNGDVNADPDAADDG